MENNYITQKVIVISLPQPKLPDIDFMRISLTKAGHKYNIVQNDKRHFILVRDFHPTEWPLKQYGPIALTDVSACEVVAYTFLEEESKYIESLKKCSDGGKSAH